jgi:hypothetical protein
MTYQTQYLENTPPVKLGNLFRPCTLHLPRYTLFVKTKPKLSTAKSDIASSTCAYRRGMADKPKFTQSDHEKRNEPNVDQASRLVLKIQNKPNSLIFNRKSNIDQKIEHSEIRHKKWRTNPNSLNQTPKNETNRAPSEAGAIQQVSTLPGQR